MDARLSLMEVFNSSELIDHRKARGLRHPLGAILALTTVAMLSGVRSQKGVVEFGRDRGRDFLKLFGFRKFKGPSEATISRVFASLDVVAFEACVRRWIVARAGRRFEHVAIDGKTVRGSRDGSLPAVHLLTAYAPEIETTLAQLRVDAKTNEHKAALELLGATPLSGKIVTADAMFTHRDFCVEVVGRGGDFVLPIKANQPNLLRDVKAAFADPPAGLSPPTETTSSRHD
ncbi:MAG: ISAs1 family transposase [Isosphaeraceae bacterium]|nr:ISAs1 family transposase [Isosphaeraceae bacterium]